MSSRNKNREIKPNVTFADVYGHDSAKKDLMEIIDYLRDPKK